MEGDTSGTESPDHHPSIEVAYMVEDANLQGNKHGKHYPWGEGGRLHMGGEAPQQTGTYSGLTEVKHVVKCCAMPVQRCALNRLLTTVAKHVVLLRSSRAYWV